MTVPRVPKTLLCWFVATLIIVSSATSSAAPLSLPVTLEDGAITVRAEQGMDGLAKEILKLAPDLLEDISTDLEGLPLPPHIDIRLVKDSASLSAAAPAGRGAPLWAAGVAYSDVGVVVVAARQGANPIDVPSVTAHELAHLCLGAAVGDRAPRWLHEGFAYLHSSDWSIERARTLTGLAWSGDILPLGTIDSHFPDQEIAVDRAYAQSYDFVAFLARRGQFADRSDDGDRFPFRRFLAALAAGKDIDDAALESYGNSMAKLFDQWVLDLRDRYMMAPVGLFGLGTWFLGGLLLVIAYIRKRRQNRSRLEQWEEDEAAWQAST